MSIERENTQSKFNFFKKDKSSIIEDKRKVVFSLILRYLGLVSLLCIAVLIFGKREEVEKNIKAEVESQNATMMTKEIGKDAITQLKINLRTIEPEYFNRNIRVLVDVAGKNLLLSTENKNNQKTCSVEIKGEFYSFATSNNMLNSCDTVLDRLVKFNNI